MLSVSAKAVCITTTKGRALTRRERAAIDAYPPAGRQSPGATQSA